MKLLIMQSSPLPYTSSLLGPSIFLSTILKHSQPMRDSGFRRNVEEIGGHLGYYSA
jgi:hypothetical protein